MGYLRSISTRSAPISLCSRRAFKDGFFIDRAEDGAGFVRFQLKLNLCLADLLRELLQVFAAPPYLLFHARRFMDSSFFIAVRRGRFGQLVREKKIARVAVAHVFHFIFFADVAHVAQEILLS